MAKSAPSLPPPPKSLDATLITWGGGLEFQRVHDLVFGGSSFNTSTKANARFSPITDDAGVLISIYAVEIFDKPAEEAGGGSESEILQGLCSCATGCDLRAIGHS